MKSDKQWIVIVGATGAFGSVMVERFLGLGYGVLAVARSEASLLALAEKHPGLRPCVADIAQDSATQAIARALPGPVRMVVHGPGVSVGGGVLAIQTSALVDAVNIKVGGMLRLVRAVDSQLLPDARLVVAEGESVVPFIAWWPLAATTDSSPRPTHRRPGCAMPRSSIWCASSAWPMASEASPPISWPPALRIPNGCAAWLPTAPA